MKRIAVYQARTGIDPVANAADLVDWPGHYVAAATAALDNVRSNY